MENSKRRLLALGLVLSVMSSGNIWTMEDYAATSDSTQLNNMLISLKDFDKNKILAKILHLITVTPAVLQDEQKDGQYQYILQQGNELTGFVEDVIGGVIKSHEIQKNPSNALKELAKVKEEFNRFLGYVIDALKNEDNQEVKQLVEKVRNYCQVHLNNLDRLIEYLKFTVLQ